MKSLVTMQLPKNLSILYKAAEFYLKTARWLPDYWNGLIDNNEHLIYVEAAHYNADAAWKDG